MISDKFPTCFVLGVKGNGRCMRRLACTPLALFRHRVRAICQSFVVRRADLQAQCRESHVDLLAASFGICKPLCEAKQGVPTRDTHVSRSIMSRCLSCMPEAAVSHRVASMRRVLLRSFRPLRRHGGRFVQPGVLRSSL